MFKFMPSLAALALAAMALASPSLAAERSVETLKGLVSIPEAPQRIVILNPALAGSVYALGLDVYAVTQSTRAPTEEGYSSVWAEEARASETRVLPWDFEGYNLELILNMQPDLIIAGGQGRPGSLADAAYDQLSAIAPTVFVDTAPRSWQDDLAFMAEAFGRKAEEQAALAAYDQKVADVKAAIALPPQPTVFVMAIKPGDEPYFLPEASPTPQLFADVGFEPDAILARHPDFETTSTGDSVKVSLELASEVLAAPTMVMVPWAPGVRLDDLRADNVLARLPSLASGHAYQFPDYAYRFDYYGAMAVLDDIARTFAK